MKMHNLNVVLPFNAGADATTKVLMDGKELTVAGIHIRASTDGYTNAVVEIPINVIGDMQGVIFPIVSGLTHDQWYELGRKVFEKHIKPFEEQEGEIFDASPELQVMFFKELVQEMLSTFTTGEDHNG